jgi:hypothetical protein
MPDVEVVVGAVEVGDRQVTAAYLFGLFIDPFLHGILMLSNAIKCMVNIVQGETIKWFKEKILVSERIPF